MNTKNFKDILREFWKNKVEEIKQNKIRFAAMIFFTLFAVFFMFTDDDSEKIDLTEPVEIEQEKISEVEKKSDSDKKIIYVKKDTEKIEEKNVIPVIGANSEELYIQDPFASEEKIEVAMKAEVEKIPVTPPKIPISQTPIITENLPPIPDNALNFSVSQIQQPIIPENKPPDSELILTGTIVGSDAKNAIIKKVTLGQGNNYTEENIIVGIGDYVQGQKVTDITGNFIILDNGENYMYLSGFANSEIIIDDFEDTPIENPTISDISEDYIEPLPDNNFFDIENEKSVDTAEENFEIIDDFTDDFVSRESFQEDIFATDDNLIINTDTTDNFTISADVEVSQNKKIPAESESIQTGTILSVN